MKNILTLILIILFGSNVFFAKELQVILKNTANIERNDEMIVITRDSVIKILGEISADKTLIVYDSKKSLPSQLDDLNGDGKWDELAFLADFKPQEQLTLAIKIINKAESPKYGLRTNIRFAKTIKTGKIYEEAGSATRLKGFVVDSTKHYPQFEGPGWENDKVAFRNYFDERNGIDIFGKTTSKMVLDSVGIKEEYHYLKPWGMDVLKVGNSLGAGSLGVCYKDSLYRISAKEGASFKIVAEGPVRSVLDLDFAKVQTGNLTFALKHRISIVAGEYGYRSEVHVMHPSDSFLLATGLVNLHCKELFTAATDGCNIFYTHDKQSENNDILGLGIILKKNDFIDWFQTTNNGSGVTNTFAIKMPVTSSLPVKFIFIAGWELSSPLFSDKKLFEGYLKQQAVKFENPIVYQLK
ncbi:MAG TPA: DUF4861 domain-containing protein [Bacteroidales bacterium]|nr:DUF4861 domain-containing protein [Bacteroidales bacterium]